MKPLELTPNRVRAAGLVLISVLIIGVVSFVLHQQARVQRLTIAAGSREGESYAICAALRTRRGAHNPKIKIALLETAGTVENLRFLEEGASGRSGGRAGRLRRPHHGCVVR